MLGKFVANQLKTPTGLIGRWFLAPMWNRRNAALNDLTLESLDLGSHDRLLEIGFGGGYLLERIFTLVTNGYIAGVDASQAMVTRCERRYRSLIEKGMLELHCAKVESLPFPDAHFNKVCSVNSLFYWEDVSRALQEIHRVLAEGGRLVICLTRKLYIEDKRFAHHGLALYTDDELLQMLGRVGFEELEMSQGADRHREFFCIIGRK